MTVNKSKSSKKNTPKQQPESQQSKEIEKKSVEVDSDSDDDEDLFDLAEKWANSQQETKEKKGDDDEVDIQKKDSGNAKTRKKLLSNPIDRTTDGNLALPDKNYELGSSLNDRRGNKFSLHVTNLPYNAAKEDIMQAFLERGCKITSTRLVYNYHTSRRENEKKKTKPANSNGFTGVAFVDVADETSYKLGLDMDKTMWGQDSNDNEKNFGRGWKRRRINVRPTKTKEELAQIVAQTRLKVAEQKQKQGGGKEDDVEKQSLRVEKDIEQKQGHETTSKFKRSKRKASDTPEKKRKLDKDDAGSTPKKNKQNNEDKKLTKKERAKRAAILRTKKITK